MKTGTLPPYGNISLLLAFGCMTAWAGLTELDRTVTAQGHFIPQARNQVVQVVDGGILQTLLVAEGDRVQAGQTLAVLEPTRADAALDELRSQLKHLVATRQRAESFANGQTSLQPGAEPLQRALFTQQMQALQADLAAFDAAIELAKSEIQITDNLFKAGDVSQTEVMRTQRALIELQQRRQSLLDAQRTEARREAARLQIEIDVVANRIKDRENIRGYTSVKAPVDGQVQLIKSHTRGAVLRAGEELLHISPKDSPLLVEAKINPIDMADLKPGLPARIRLDAWDFAVYGALEGTVTHISPDAISEMSPMGQPMSFYKAVVQIDPDHINPKLSNDKIKPGMTTQLDVHTGDRTLLSYLLGPIARGLSTALREK